MENKLWIALYSFAYVMYITNSRSIVSILPLPFLIYISVYYVFKDKDYSYRLYFPVIFALLVLEGLLISYIYFSKFTVLMNPYDLGMFLLCIVALISLVFGNIYYIITGKYKEFPWVKTH